MTAPPEVRLHRRYPDPVEDVWGAFTESDRLARWFGSYTGTGRPGGTVELTVTGEVDAGGEVAAPVTVTVRECVAPHRLVVEIPEGDDAWHVIVELAAVGSGTEVVLSQQVRPGLDAGDVEAGWSWYLDRLGAVLRGAAMPRWAEYAPPG
jgi:uncharacterized protein YndB with AHSA1/START domain